MWKVPGSPYLQLQHQVHSVFAKRVDVTENQGDDDVDPIRFVSGDAGLEKEMTVKWHAVCSPHERWQRKT